MHIMHISDTHLGYAQFNLKEREDDVYDAFNYAIDTAIKDKVYAVIHSGDIFHKPNPSGNAMHRFTDAVKRLNEHGIRFFFTLGEHDISRVRDRPMPLIFDDLRMAEYIGDGKVHKHDKVVLVGFHKYRRGEIDTLVNKLMDVEGMVSAYRSDGYRLILVMHQGLYEFHGYAGELSMDALPKGFDYYAMGHLHEHSSKNLDRGVVSYPGSIDVIQSDSINAKRGFCMVDLSTGNTGVELVESKPRAHIHYEISYDRLKDDIDRIVKELQRRGLTKKPIVYIDVHSDSTVDNAHIASNLARLNEHALHYTWNIMIKGLTGKVYTERPDIDEELFSLARDVLGSDEEARFAIHELLDMLSRDALEDAVDAVWKRFSREVAVQ
jgi:exonuclease SbcD